MPNTAFAWGNMYVGTRWSEREKVESWEKILPWAWQLKEIYDLSLLSLITFSWDFAPLSLSLLSFAFSLTNLPKIYFCLHSPKNYDRDVKWAVSGELYIPISRSKVESCEHWTLILVTRADINCTGKIEPDICAEMGKKLMDALRRIRRRIIEVWNLFSSLTC